MSDSLPVIVLGAGGHAKVVVDTLTAMCMEIAGMVDPNPETHGRDVLGIPVLGGDEEMETRPAAAFALANGVGSTGDAGPRRAVFDRFREQGYAFPPVIHPTAVIAAGVEIRPGTQIMAGAIIQPDCRIGENVIINTGAQVDHDGKIGDHVHVAPGAVLGGAVTVGPETHIGTGACVIQNVCIGADVLVAVGAAIVTDVPDGTRIAGVPAREIAK